ncbi:metallophosphoesterase family protein [Micromonospora sp. DT4]|uniref:metallophosphoesterase family protein n=1 Tax=Micromonospora sp. DT4 TaxID=3393438 RepID=UPI003CF0C54C
MSVSPRLRAVSDLHISYAENRAFVQELHPEHPGDWLLVAGDVADRFADIEWALELLSSRFATVVWAPGNHELWTPPGDPEHLRGETRYRELVAMCQRLGVVTPEDPYPVWDGEGGPATIAPLFVLYDYTFRVPQASTKQESLDIAYAAGVVCTDEALLHPDPYPSREAWCDARVTETERRLTERDPDLPTVLVNHYPLVREPTDILWFPEFAQWCGTVRTRDWHLRFGASTMVYGHLHIPRTTFYDGVRFEEVSLGYPREWRRRGPTPNPVRTINPADDVRRRTSVTE